LHQRASAPGRRERQRLANRKEILDTALRLFSENGYHNVSMHRIAQEAEFSIGTLYNFFKDKEDLYHALVMELAREFERELTAALDGPGDEAARIRAYIQTKGRILMNNVPMLRIYFLETRGAIFDAKTGLDLEVRALYERFLKRLARVFASGTKKGLFKRMLKPYYMACVLESITNTFLLLWLEDPGKHPYTKNVEKVTTLFLENITTST